MKNIITKYLIVLFGVVILSFTANSVSASVFYDPSEVQNPAVNSFGTTKTTTPTIINNYNYYYQTPPTVSKTSPTTSDTSKKTTSDPINNLGASALNSIKTAPALSANGNGGFLPSSVWQWVLTVILILIIIIVARMFVRKPDPADHDAHH